MKWTEATTLQLSVIVWHDEMATEEDKEAARTELKIRMGADRNELQSTRMQEVSNKELGNGRCVLSTSPRYQA